MKPQRLRFSPRVSGANKYTVQRAFGVFCWVHLLCDMTVCLILWSSKALWQGSVFVIKLLLYVVHRLIHIQIIWCFRRWICFRHQCKRGKDPRTSLHHWVCFYVLCTAAMEGTVQFYVHSIFHYLHRMREDPSRAITVGEKLLNFQNRWSCWASLTFSINWLAQRADWRQRFRATLLFPKLLHLYTDIIICDDVICASLSLP
jgi:hypothetical protein